MAKVPYSPAQAVEPNVQQPNDYLRVEANPAAFGAAIGQGLEQFGQGATSAAQFYGQIAADDTTNNVQDTWNKRLYGDPNKTVIGPDGQPQQDTGFFGLKGSAQLAARPQLEQDMDNDLKQARAGLKSPESQLQFDSNTRRYRQMVSSKIGESADRAMTEYGLETNAKTVKTTSDSIANDAADDKAFQHHLADLQLTYRKISDLKGLGKVGADAANVQGAQEAWQTRLMSLSVSDRDRAWDLVHNPSVKTQLGDNYDKVLDDVKKNVAESYISQTNQLEVEHPEQALPFVQANKEKFSDRYGEIEKQVWNTDTRAAGQKLYDEAGTKKPPTPVVPAPLTVPPAPGSATGTAPAPPPATKSSFAVGDSLADGVRTTAKIAGDTKVGRPSSNPDVNNPGVLQVLESYPEARVEGQSLIISSGISNDAKKDVSVVKKQIDIAKSKGYSPVILGVGDKFADLNPKIKEIAEANGARFVPIGANDGVHPTDGYRGVTARALGGGRAATPGATPGDISTGPAANIDKSIPPEGRALLATIGGPEAGGQYNVRYGGAHFDGYADHPRIHERITTGPNAGKTSDAAGRYQFLGSTWNEAKNALGLTDFSPASQDKAAWWLAQKTYRDATGGDLLTALKSGDPAKLDGIARALHSTWTSLPGGIEEGTTTGRFAATYGAALQGKGASTIASREPSSYAPPRAGAAPTPEETPTERPTAIPASASSEDIYKPIDANVPPEEPPISEEAQITLAAQKLYHDKLQGIDESDAPDKAKVAAAEIAKRRYEMEMARAGLVGQQRLERERALTDDIFGIVRKYGPQAGYKRLEQAVNAHQADNKFYDTISDVIEKRTLVPNPASLGNFAKYQDFFKRMLLPDDDPNKLRGRMEIFQAEAKGEITKRGADELIKQQDLLPSSHDEYGYAKNNDAAHDYMKRHLVRENAYPGDKSVDQKGYDKLDTVAVPLYNSQYDKWHRASQEGVKGTPDTFPLWDQKNLDAFLETVYSRRDRERDALGANPQPEEPGTAPPPPPQGFNPQGWATLMQQAPQLKSGGVNHLKFSNDIETLAADPKEMIPLWNAAPIGQRLPAERVLDMLGVPYDRTAAQTIPEPNAAAREQGPADVAANRTAEQHIEDQEFDRWLQSIPTAVLKKLNVQIGKPNPAGILNPAAARDVKAFLNIISRHKGEEVPQTAAQP